MTTIFIKPNNGKFCIAIFEHDDASIKLARVSFPDNEPEIIDFLENHKPESVEALMFDGTIYAQTAISIREQICFPVRIFKEKGKVHDRIEAHSEWLAENMKYNSEMKNNADYMRFIRMLSDYSRNNQNCDTTAADLMADAARYFRRTI